MSLCAEPSNGSVQRGETLAQMTARVSTFAFDSVPYEPSFGLPKSLNSKVIPSSGELAPFYGNTIVYELDAEVIAELDEITDSLYEEFAASLCTRISPDTYHLTLHDLHSSPQLPKVAANVFTDTPRALQLVDRARIVGPIAMRCTCVFNLVNTSIVVGLLPITDEDCERLAQARALFDEITPAGLFTPHITLAYYRPDAPQELNPEKLRQLLAELSTEIDGLLVALHPGRLQLWQFASMANYWRITKVGD